MLAAHGLAAEIHLEEGSGISRDDRFTARGLAKVLELFAPHADLLRGHDGGMNKTGTKEGIRTLAGYADTSSHERARFVISLASNDGEMRFRLLRGSSSPGCSRSFAPRSMFPHSLTNVWQLPSREGIRPGLGVTMSAMSDRVSLPAVQAARPIEEVIHAFTGRCT
jgi:hypothetical protein